ncbi:MAG TPA: hypothetical protein VFQ77_11810 [Pseudonocardiaceae bacterium]|jgi:hypothetical protein|nr:hypothetical protein [Pseudonocardiaceae bacterium]
MRFPHPVALACLTCGQPTVVAETATGAVRVHCGTWRWQCDTPATTRESRRYHPLPGNPTGPDPTASAGTGQPLAA